ncbi:L,D-transpeptidase family protein [Wohlfahrtiimonas larvae]
MKKTSLLCLTVTISLLNSIAIARQYPMPEKGTDIIGYTEVIYPEPGESFVDISVKYEAGYDELKWANPNANYWTPSSQMPIVLPFEYILPGKKRVGIVSNIPEMRTYYFPANEDVVYVYPVGVGRMDWKTPLGTWKVTIKQEAPPWYPPESIRREHQEMGKGILPRVVPAGPDNPLGNHVLRLNIPSYLLHGTNDVTGIGMRVTHGCMRFFPQNIEELHRIVPSGTPVSFINEPIKVGWKGDELLIEVHPPLEEDNLDTEGLKKIAYRILAPYQNDPNIQMVDRRLLDLTIEKMSGLPTHVGQKIDPNTLNPQPPTGGSAINIDWDKFKK